MGKFDDIIKKRSDESPWLKIEDGQTIQGKFTAADRGVNSFGNVQAMVNLDVAGINKVFQSGATKAFNFFNDLAPGTEVTITRKGVGNKTRYEFTKVGEDSPF